VTVRALFWVTVVIWALTLAWAAATLPERVPVHFGLTGAADRFTGRGRAVVELALVGVLLAAVFAASVALCRNAPLRFVNVPYKSYWSEPGRQDQLRQRLQEDLWVLGAATMTFLAGMVVVTTAAADQPSPSLGSGGWVLLACYLAAVIGYTAYVLLHRYRPGRG
jgi:sterol desaturase/sphingolipid hydroxylase (fatty acid hydroxylase superfamily)